MLVESNLLSALSCKCQTPKKLASRIKNAVGKAVYLRDALLKHYNDVKLRESLQKAIEDRVAKDFADAGVVVPECMDLRGMADGTYEVRLIHTHLTFDQVKQIAIVLDEEATR